MSEFAYLFRGREPGGSPDEMQQQMDKWVAWMKQLGAEGRIKDPGNPLERTGKVVSGRQRVVSDGPYAEAKDLVGGYIVVEAADLTQAAEIARGCPIFDAGGFVEVRPIRTMNV